LSVRVEVVDCIRRGGEEELRVVNSWGRAGRERFKDEKSREEREREKGQKICV
jgi:hypothetical protein